MIRKATDRDIVRIAEILVFNNRLNFYPIFKDREFSFRDFNVIDVCDDIRSDPEFICNTFVCEDTIIKGFVCITDREIKKLYVEPALQNEGTGAQLMDFVVNRMGADRLWALEKNADAIRFYERHGFHKSGEKRPVVDGAAEYLVELVR